MKVCDVVINSIWYDPRVRKQINEYLRNGVELSCVGYECSRYDVEKIKQIPCKVNVVRRPSKYLGKQKSIIKKILRERVVNIAIRDAIIEEKPDIIHANDLGALVPAYMASKKLKCKLIYDSHEINTENLFYRDKKLYKIIMGIKERKICKKVDKMICVSHAAADYFEKKYKIEKPMVITNCSIKSEQVISGNKNEGFEVLNHGMFYEGRGYDVMVESLPLLKQTPKIKIALRGMGKMEQQLRDRAKEVGDDNFIIYPPVHVSELIKSASTSMVGVAITEVICLNFELSVSNKLFEYASAGLPVIMSDIPEHRYLNDKFNFGIIIKQNTPECFADAVLKLYNDKELYKTLSKNAILLSNKVNWENEFSKLIKFERDIVK